MAVVSAYSPLGLMAISVYRISELVFPLVIFHRDTVICYTIIHQCLKVSLPALFDLLQVKEHLFMLILK